MNAPARPFAAALLAGGKSSRMGGDKALLEWRGQPLWRFQVGKLIELNPDRLLLSCREEQRLKNVFAEFVFDPPDNPGPLGAIARCLEVAQLPLLVLAVDMPQMTAEFLRSLLDECADCSRGLVCQSAESFEPLCAVYPVQAQELLRAMLRDGVFKMQTVVEGLAAMNLVRVRELRADELPLFFNANTPQEYAWMKSAPPASS